MKMNMKSVFYLIYLDCFNHMYTGVIKYLMHDRNFVIKHR